jgi:hypothetical protein
MMRASFMRTIILGTTLAVAALACPPAALAEGSAWWSLNVTAAPSFLPREGEARIIVTATNLGDGDVDAGPQSPVILTDELPEGVTVDAVAPEVDKTVPKAVEQGCSVTGRLVTCEYTLPAAPYQSYAIEIVVATALTGAPSTVGNIVKVQGGATTSPPALERPLRVEQVEGDRVPFGVEAYELIPEAEDGSRDTRAGSHPFQLTTLLDLNQSLVQSGAEDGEGAFPSAPALPRNLRFKLPPGLLGDPSAVPECSGVDFSSETGGGTNLCPANTAVGVAGVTLLEPAGLIKLEHFLYPVFNLEPAAGEPARFGIFFATPAGAVPIILKTAVPSGGEYGVEVNVEDASQAAQVLFTEVTIWGVPGDVRHDASRGWACLDHASGCELSTESTPNAFLTLPTSCGRAPETSVSGESWAGGPYAPRQTFTGTGPSTPFPALTSCSLLGFSPSIALKPEQEAASTPSGLEATVQMPQQGLTAASGFAESALKEATVALPRGMQLNPSAANALEACSALDFGSLSAAESEGGHLLEGSEEEMQTANEHFTTGPPACPDAAKIGTVNITTPLLKNEVAGSLYLAAQNANPFRSPLALYLVAEDKTDGILVKLAGEVRIDEATGQITTTFRNTPPLPFSDLHLHLFGGQRGSLSTPPLCGSYAAESTFTPWSGGAPAKPGAGFTIGSGPNGTPCPSAPLPFAPGFAAGSTNSQAGGFTSFNLQIQRPDGQQQLTGITVHLPPGIAGLLSKVTPCPEPPLGQEWSCGPESLIGHSLASAGLGSEPFTLPGSVYLTSGYEGAPFGVLVQTPAVAGPFNLGMVNVRSRIDVNPENAAVTITTDAGPRGEAIPTRLKGVPAQLQQIQVDVDRPGFLFNPTDCNPFSINGSLAGDEGASSGVSYPFRVTNCATLPFTPKLTAAAGGHGSKANGTSFTVKLESSGVGSSGVAQSNIAKVDLTIPSALPSRLTTIQKACVAAVFEANPASCDEGSVIGEATVHTPVLKSPLTGPGYLVSHGGAEFPDVEFVLQGEGIKLVLDGKTDIKHGVTYSKFESAPDAPFTAFETTLPAGPHSAFSPNVPEQEDFSLCRTSLSMPTVITGQNGAVIEQDTKVDITGCGGVKPFKASKLDEALKACQKKYKHRKGKRLSCEKLARKKYGAKKASKASGKKTAKRS